MTQKVLLGVMADDIDVYAAGRRLLLTKHSWDCDWYWGFGYLGNNDCHFHFDSLLNNVYCGGKMVQWPMPRHLFKSTNITEKEWWVIRDLFTQAYALRKAAEVYRYGGHNTTLEGVTDIIRKPVMAKVINNHLQQVLDTLWEYVVKATQPKDSSIAA